jgi:hypothetical protein
MDEHKVLDVGSRGREGEQDKLEAASDSTDQSAMKPSTDFKAALAGAVAPAMDFRAMRAFMTPELDIKAMLAAVMTPTLDFKAMRPFMTPALDIKSMQAAVMTPPLDFQAIRAFMSPALDIKAMQAAVMTPALDFKAMRSAFFTPTLDFKAMQAAVMTPPLDFQAIRAFMSPALDIKAMQAAVMTPALDFKAMRSAFFTPTLDFKAMQAAVMTPALDFKAMQAAAMSPTLDFKAMQAAFKTPALDFKAIQAMMKSLPAMATLGASLAVISSLPASQHFQWHTLNPQALLQTINTATPGQSNPLASLISKLTENTNSVVSEEDVAAAQTAIEAELATVDLSGNTANLSVSAKWLLTWLLWLVSASFGYLALQNGVREELCFLQPKIIPGMTSGQLGKAIRSAVCGAPLELLKDYRFVRGESVRLRAAPGMKSEILQVSLSDGAILEVLENDNRVWLHVSVVGQEGVEGWVSKKYVRRFVD